MGETILGIIAVLLVAAIIIMAIYKAVYEICQFFSKHWLPILVIGATVVAAVFTTIEIAGLVLLIGVLIGVVRCVYNKLF